MPVVRALFVEYAGWIGVDLSFQGFAEELAALPGKYAEPAGTVLLGLLDGVPCGCVALRRIEAEICEMKRLYVQSRARGKGAGRELVRLVITAARDRGYRRMRLDTLSSMEAAQTLYREMGFREIPPYIFNPLPGAIFMEKDLRE